MKKKKRKNIHDFILFVGKQETFNGYFTSVPLLVLKYRFFPIFSYSFEKAYEKCHFGLTIRLKKYKWNRFIVAAITSNKFLLTQWNFNKRKFFWKNWAIYFVYEWIHLNRHNTSHRFYLFCVLKLILNRKKKQKKKGQPKLKRKYQISLNHIGSYHLCWLHSF